VRGFVIHGGLLLLGVLLSGAVSGRATVGPNEIGLGLGYLDDDSVRIDDRAGIDRAGLHLLGEFDISRRIPDREGTGYWAFRGSDLTLGTRELALQHGHQGRYRLQIEYRERQTRNSDQSESPFPNPGGTSLALPAGWVPAATTAGMTGLSEDLQRAPLGFDRKMARLSWGQALGEAWWFNGNVRRETRRGTRPMAGTFGAGGNPRSILLPAPLDFTTQDLELRFDYARPGTSLRSGYRLAVFDNGDQSLRWQNPFATIAGWVPAAGYPTGFGQLALEPDNRQHQLFTSGAWRVHPDLRLSGELQLGRLRQDQGFLPYTVNPAISADIGLPRTSLDGRVDTARIDLRAHYTPAGPFSGGLGYRYDDRENRTPRDVFLYVAGDARNQDSTFDVVRARQNLPYSFSRESVDLHGAWRWRNGVRLRGEARRLTTDRDFSDLDRTRDDSLKARLQGTLAAFAAPSSGGRSARPAAAANWRWHAETGLARRRGDDYRGDTPWLATHTSGYVDTVAEDLRFANHPLLRKYYLADRDRREAQAGLQWLSGGSLTLGLTGVYRLDDFPASELGLTESRSRTVTVDAGWSPRPGDHLDVWFSRDAYDSDQQGHSFRGNALRADLQDPARRWAVAMHDRIDTAGFGWRRDLLVPGVDGGFDYLWSLGRSDFSTRTGASLANAPVPEVVSRIQRLDLYLRYRIDERLSIRAGWLHERGRVSDWVYADTDAATVANVVGLGEASPDYRVNWVTLRLYYRLE